MQRRSIRLWCPLTKIECAFQNSLANAKKKHEALLAREQEQIKRRDEKKERRDGKKDMQPEIEAKQDLKRRRKVEHRLLLARKKVRALLLFRNAPALFKRLRV